jgi:hypothetical protein
MTQIEIARTKDLAKSHMRLLSELHNAYNADFAPKSLLRPSNERSVMQGKPLRMHGRTHMTAQERREMT